MSKKYRPSAKALFCVVLLIMAESIRAQANQAIDLVQKGLKKYALASGSINYSVSGAASGEELMYFSENGWRSVRKQKLFFELYGVKTVQEMVEVTDGDFIYRLNPGDSTYKERRDPKWSQLAAYKTPDKTSESVLTGLGGLYKADSTLMDRNCQVWQFNGRVLKELWVWKGVVLKRKIELGGELVVSTANQIDITSPVDQQFFEIPPYYRKTK